MTHHPSSSPEVRLGFVEISSKPVEVSTGRTRHTIHYSPYAISVIFSRRTRLSISHQPSVKKQKTTYPLHAIFANKLNIFCSRGFLTARTNRWSLDSFYNRGSVVIFIPIWSIAVIHHLSYLFWHMSSAYARSSIEAIVYFLRINLEPFQIIGRQNYRKEARKVVFFWVLYVALRCQPKVTSVCLLSRNFRKILWRAFSTAADDGGGFCFSATTNHST